jgi:hypothetical protein
MGDDSGSRSGIARDVWMELQREPRMVPTTAIWMGALMVVRRGTLMVPTRAPSMGDDSGSRLGIVMGV